MTNKQRLPALWSACGLCIIGWPPGDCPGLAGEGRGILGEPGQLEAAGDAILCEDGNGLLSLCPKEKNII